MIMNTYVTTYAKHPNISTCKIHQRDYTDNEHIMFVYLFMRHTRT